MKSLKKKKNQKKCDIVNRIKEVYTKENTMIDFKAFLTEKLEKIDMSSDLEPDKIKLTEADDDQLLFLLHT